MTPVDPSLALVWQSVRISDINRSRTPRRAIIYTYNPARLGKVNEGRFPADTW